ncbi:MAG: citrate synthase 2 [Actinomycetota bacterium]|nr:MAG: citrate synthase 2 [Actinomycetota bacterium]
MTEKGLRDVVAAQTRISDIDGERGRLWYVGYPIEDLAEHATFEEVVYLLHHGELPTPAQLDQLVGFLTRERGLSPFGTKIMPILAHTASPMSMLRTMVSGTSTYDPDGWDESPEAQYRKALRLIARVPTMIATYHRLRTGQEVIPPNPELSHAANFLWMLHGEEARPDDVRAMDVSFILYADHTMNASTFTARIIASTLADMFSAITGAIAALKGPLHGGANEESMKMLEEIGKPENASAYVAERLARKQKIFGFGHAVYRTMDPRATIFREFSRRVGEAHGDLRWYEISRAVEESTFEQKGLYPNVDFYAASVYHMLGIPTDLMTPIFALARMAGWTAHVREQYADNRVIRPDSEYVGPPERRWVPLEARA